VPNAGTYSQTLYVLLVLLNLLVLPALLPPTLTGQWCSSGVPHNGSVIAYSSFVGNVADVQRR